MVKPWLTSWSTTVARISSEIMALLLALPLLLFLLLLLLSLLFLSNPHSLQCSHTLLPLKHLSLQCCHPLFAKPGAHLYIAKALIPNCTTALEMEVLPIE